MLIYQNIYKVFFHLEFMKSKPNGFHFSIYKNKMKKRGVALLILGLFVFSIFVSSVSLIGAQEDKLTFDHVGDVDRNDAIDVLNNPSTFSGKVKSFFVESPLGYLRGTNLTAQKVGIVGWLFFLLILIFIYSGLDFFKFPDSKMFQIIISAVVAFIVMGLITPEEIKTALTSYSALGITFVVIIPVIILAFFSLMVSVKAHSMGLLAQRIMWVIYSLYLFIRSGVLVLAKFFNVTNFDFMQSAEVFNKSVMGRILLFFGSSHEAVKNASGGDPLILVINVVVSILVIVFFVFLNGEATHWIMEQARHYAEERFRDRQSRASTVEESRADATRE
jgi:hypothetical protein